MLKNGYTYKLLLKGDDAANSYKVMGYPTFYIINKDGVIIHSHSGYMEDLEKYLSEIIDKEIKGYKFK